MASRQFQGKMTAEGPSVKSFGTYSIRGYEDRTEITLTTDLEYEPFPSDQGTELKVEEVIPENGSPFLRLIPVNHGDD